MADPTKTLSGKETLLKIATNLTTPVYKGVVCSIDNGLTGTSNVQKTETKCGTAKARGTSDHTVTGSLAANTAPDSATEMSNEDLLALFISGDDFLWEVVNGTDLLRKGTGFLSAYSETYPTADVVKADFTIDVKGNVATA
jgi:hypothetical protein